MAGIRRFFSEKREEFAIEAFGLFQDLRENLGIRSLERVRVLNRYDIEGISDEEYRQVRQSIFCEPPLDLGYDERFLLAAGEQAFAIEYLPGQYDQRADSAAQCVQLLTHRAPPNVATARVIVLCGPLSAEEVRRVKSYLINPVDSHEAGMAKPETLALTLADPLPVERLTGFIHLGGDGLSALRASLGLAMDLEDLLYCQRYFRERESRDPTITEIRMLDTYWSDHCRHTTFLTHIRSVQIPPGPYSRPLVEAYRVYLQAREFVHGDTGRPICLMDIAQMGMREQAKRGLLPDLDSSDEINACSITIGVDVEGRTEEWLLMFKNETHNHPTEIEPFGGAATCLGGAIRDPLSGRAYVYQAMRLTGSGDPRTPVKETLPGKLPQRKITREAARGYSSYGNQVGLATGKVTEVYDEGYVAKRMEVGAVIGAVPRADVVRGKPAAGDCILLVGGATGRDGIGGATGSSKAHTEASIRTCGAEVQKGNPVIERKIQRLFRNRLATRLIKRCNDFGAGGVSVAVGELAEGLDIDLDAIPKKYEGLDGTELALSESQERMAVMVEAVDVEPFRRLATEENLEATPIARVTADRRLRMHWRGDTIVDIGRDFLDSAGVRRHTDVWAPDPEAGENPFRHPLPAASRLLPDLKAAWLALLADPNLCDQHGLVEQFDSSIGRGTVLFPYGGLYQATPAEGMAARIPLLEGKTSTATVMTHGFDPRLSRWSPFHGGFYAVVEATARMVACGADHTRIRLSLQEYFEKPGSDPRRWGKPFAALLGAYFAQKQLGIAAIGGKDSMSGSFKELDVPPTLAAFAVTTVDSEQVMSPEFKEPGSRVVLLSAERDEDEMPDTERLAATFKRVFRLRSAGVVRSAISLRGGGLAAALSLMALGNRIGLRLDAPLDAQRLFFPDWGSLVVEIPASEEPRELFSGIGFLELGRTVAEPKIEGGGISISLAEIEEAWEGPLAGIFPPRGGPRLLEKPQAIPAPTYAEPTPKRAAVKVARPRVLITVMPGTNCEYDTARAFALAGAVPDTLVFRNLTPAMIEESLEALVSRLGNSQILVIPGGFSAGDEPEGSGKFLTAVFRNRRAQDAVARFIERGDGLILGICNGFQALVKLGLLPDERIRELTDASPTLTFNGLGRFVSRLVRTRVVSTLSPWFSLCQVGDIHIVPVAHGEGRFIASSEQLEALASRGQVATQYVDLEGRPAPASDGRFNPNGSYWAVEAISSPDGRILGRMAHPERVAEGLFRNIPGMVESPVFRSGVHYFS